MTGSRITMLHPQGPWPEAHPLADVFPAMLRGAFLPFCEDVRRHGVHDPVILFEGRILDGRARAQAARELGQPCPAVNYEGPDPIGLLVSLNLARRHLDESQRAMVASRIATLRRGRPRADSAIAGISQERASEILNVSIDSIGRARHVQESGVPALARAVERGEIAVSAAAAIAEEPRARQAQILAFPPREILAAAKQLRLQRQAEKRGERLERLAAITAKPAPFPAGRRYPIIYADPPWEHEVWSEETGGDRSALNHYPTMSLDEILALPVGELAADDALLPLWATVPRLADALAVMERWGFRYRSNQVWRKDRAGTGYWFRNRHEHLLIGVRGRFPAPLPGTQADSVFDAPFRGHSVKPLSPAEMIERLWPNVPRIELFGRGEHARPGWDWWGYEAGQAAAAGGAA